MGSRRPTELRMLLAKSTTCLRTMRRPPTCPTLQTTGWAMQFALHIPWRPFGQYMIKVVELFCRAQTRSKSKQAAPTQRSVPAPGVGSCDEKKHHHRCALDGY
ncbi:hypothetical protein GQ600_13830 [Phytophthora cactorum]|nr:hypothetical protein GQ600_13830 [Phytophthora cactorum]